MSKPLSSERIAKGISSLLFLAGLAALIFTNAWWPWIMLVIGIPLALRQCLKAEYKKMVISLILFIGLFISGLVSVSWKLLLPILIILVGVEYFMSSNSEDEDKEAKEGNKSNNTKTKNPDDKKDEE